MESIKKDNRAQESKEVVVDSRLYSRHFSPFLTWQWHFQDFAIDNVRLFQGDFAMAAELVPRFALFLQLANSWRGRKNRLGLPTTIRVANHAAIVTSGLILEKPKKEGDVIAEHFSIRCAAPIVYGPRDRIPIHITLHSLTETNRAFIYHANFSVGANNEHTGAMIHHYTKAQQE